MKIARMIRPNCRLWGIGCLGVIYLLAIGLLPVAALAAPPKPSTPTATCDGMVGGKCWVRNSSTLTTSSNAAAYFQICRSNNIDPFGSNLWGGCNAWIPCSNANCQLGSSYTISGSEAPPDGIRRAYRFRACDTNHSCSALSSPVYVQLDSIKPTAPGPTMANCTSNTQGATGCWTSGIGGVTISGASATDTGGSGLNSNGYRICRSNDNDTGQFCGCSKDIVFEGPRSVGLSESSSHLPADGKRRCYLMMARDNVRNGSPWNQRLYLRVDRHDPTVSANNASTSWFSSRTATISASDTSGVVNANSGLKEVRYRWNGTLDTACTNGTVTANGAGLQVPQGENTLHLCAKDYTDRVTHWQGGPYRVTTRALGVTGFRGYTWGCDGGCEFLYDPSVLDRGQGLEVFAHGWRQNGPPFTDTVAEGEWLTEGQADRLANPLAEVQSEHLCFEVPDLRNVSGGPDVLVRPGSANATKKDRMLFYTRGNADAYRGRAALAYEENGVWKSEDKKFLLHTLCDESHPDVADQCTEMGVARVAAMVVGNYYYLYSEVFAREDSSTEGIVLTRVKTSPNPPYVVFGANQSQVWWPQTGEWKNLDYDEEWGYSFDFCDWTRYSFANGMGFDFSSWWSSWRVLPNATLGDVSLTHEGNYILTYRQTKPNPTPADWFRWVDYIESSDPKFVNAPGSRIEFPEEMTLNPVIQSVKYAALYKDPASTTDYILFFAAKGNHREVIRSAQVKPVVGSNLFLKELSKAADGSTEMTISGWGELHSAEDSVMVTVDGKPVDLLDFTVESSCKDLRSTLSDAESHECALARFTGRLETSSLSNGQHILTTTVIDRDGEERTSTRTFHVQND